MSTDSESIVCRCTEYKRKTEQDGYKNRQRQNKTIPAQTTSTSYKKQIPSHRHTTRAHRRAAGEEAAARTAPGAQGRAHFWAGGRQREDAWNVHPCRQVSAGP